MKCLCITYYNSLHITTTVYDRQEGLFILFIMRITNMFEINDFFCLHKLGYDWQGFMKLDRNREKDVWSD